MFEAGTVVAAGVELGLVGGVLGALLLVWMLVVGPVTGRIDLRRMRAALEAGDADARLRLYRESMVWSWGMALLALVLALALPGVGLERLGVQLPQWGAASAAAAGSPLVKWLLVGMLFATVAMVAAGYLQAEALRRRPPKEPIAIDGEVLAILPRTDAERRGYVAMAVTAGVTEEILWRGVLLAAMVAFLPPLPAVAYILAGAVLFGLAHAYQGVTGVMTTGMVGGFFMGTYLATGSLLVPVVLHVLIDLNVMRLPLPEQPSNNVQAHGPDGGGDPAC